MKPTNDMVFKDIIPGGLLLFSALCAIAISNSPWQHSYFDILASPFTLNYSDMSFSKPLNLWINEGLMALFFLLVGLEIKRELIVGELNSAKKISLPLLGALGGMIVPAGLYCLIAYSVPQALNGWAIPTATDIAFSLGVLSLFGRRLPPSLRIFLMALAIFDDLGAIIIIGLFYSDHMSIIALLLSSISVLGLCLLNYYQVVRLLPYCLIGLALWVFVLKSGVHATLSGVILALAIPVRGPDSAKPLQYLEHTLEPWVTYLILPLFAFTNSGISFSGLHLSNLFSPVVLAIIIGLFVGKQLGILSVVWLLVKLGFQRPAKATWLQIYGISLLCGIGFTMSLFIGTLAFEDMNEVFSVWVRLGVLLGSGFSGILGYIILRQSVGSHKFKGG